MSLHEEAALRRAVRLAYRQPHPAQALCRWALAECRPLEQGGGAVDKPALSSCKNCHKPLARHNHTGICSTCQMWGGRCEGCGTAVAYATKRCRVCYQQLKRAAAAAPIEPPALVTATPEPDPAPVPVPLPPTARVAADPCPVGPSHLFLPYGRVMAGGFTAYCTLCAPSARPDAHKQESDLLPRRPKPRERGERVA